MKKHSAGAILFTIYNNQIHIVLGMEKNDWFPFKGTANIDESLENAAIREIFEETCGLVILDNIYLSCKYTTKRKYYYIGLVFVDITILNRFYINKKKYENKNNFEDNYRFLEKTDIKLFNINKIDLYNFHNITQIPIDFYKNFLTQLQKKIDNNIEKLNIEKLNYKKLNYKKLNYKNNEKLNIEKLNYKKLNYKKLNQKQIN